MKKTLIALAVAAVLSALGSLIWKHTVQES